jgi:hypothetical protein
MYQQAYFNQQCAANPLYNTQCPGYADAYRQKLFADSCAANPQSNPTCPGYRAPTVAIAPVATTAAIPSSEVPLVADPVVNQVIAPTVKKDDPAQVVPGPPAASISSASVTSPVIPLGQGIQPSRAVRSSGATTTASTRARAVAANTERAAVQTAQKSAEEAKQDAQFAALANVPGFNAYQAATIPDAAFYRQEQIYTRATIPDNQRAQRALNQRSDIIHQRMVDQQFNLSGAR